MLEILVYENYLVLFHSRVHVEEIDVIHQVENVLILFDEYRLLVQFVDFLEELLMTFDVVEWIHFEN